MLPSAPVALVPVVLGVALGLAPGAGRTLWGPLRTLALTAALAVVAVDLLPGAWRALGWVALPVFGLGLLGPALANHTGGHGDPGKPAAAGGRLLLELGFVGLLVHQLLDGAQIAAAPQLGNGLGVRLAVIAHSTPLVAAVVAGTAATAGRGPALVRAFALAAASITGALIVGASGTWLSTVQPYASAAIAGLLVGMVVHGLRDDVARLRHPAPMDLVAGLVGLALPLLALQPGNHDHAEPAPEPAADPGPTAAP